MDNQMFSLNEFVFEAWIDGSGPNRMEGRFMISFDRDVSVKGIRRMMFYMGEAELEALERNTFSHTLEDVIHRLNISGDRLTFYDFEIPLRHAEGTMEVPYLSVHFPVMARRIVARVVRRIWNNLRANLTPENRYDIPRVRFSLTPQQAERLSCNYGCGTGDVNVLVREDTRERYALDLQNESFRQRIDQLKAGCRNSTQAKWQRSELSLSRDWDGYFFVDRSPKGRERMHGGIINHGRGQEPDWSIHT